MNCRQEENPMSNNMICLALSHDTLEEIALEASALTKALGTTLDQATADKLRIRKIATPDTDKPRQALFDLGGIWPEVLW
jgi:hypothetical protein